MKSSPISLKLNKVTIKTIALLSILTALVFSLLAMPAFAQTTNTKPTNGANASNTPAPEIDYAVLNTLDKAKLVMVIRCLTTQGVNTNQAIENCLPIVSKAPLNPVRKDISAVPAVKVIYPNGAEKLTEGSIVRVKYNATSANAVDIRLWNSLSPTVDLATNLSPDGYYDWKVRAVSGYTADYAIGVRAKNANGSTYDLSDQYIKIIKSTSSSTPGSASSSPRTGLLTEQQAASAQIILEKVRNIIKIFPF